MKYDPPFYRTNGLVPVIVIFCALLLAPFVFTEVYIRHILILVFIYAIIASNWDISLGYGGIVNFAHLSFFAIGLYGYGIMSKVIGIDPWISLILAPILSVAFAAVLAIPILRLEGIYVILVTVAATQLLLQVVISQSDWTGGTSGMVLLPRLTIGEYKLNSDNRLGYYYLALGLLASSTVFLYKLQRSSLGRAIKALRDNKYYAIARGVSEARIRLMTLCASAVFTGLAGAFYGTYLRVASPDVFGLSFITITLSILLLGGLSTIWGSLIAAFVIIVLSQLLSEYGAWRNIIVAAIIITTVIIYPGGLYAAIQELWGVANRLKTNLIAAYSEKFRAALRRKFMGGGDTLVRTAHGTISVFDTNTESEQTLVFIHGNSACKEVFRHQVAAFRDKYRIVAFDLPGHGVSRNANPETDYNIGAYADIAHELVEMLDLKNPILFGWSLGGYIALEYAARGYPLAGLAICGTSPLTTYPDDFPRGYIATPHLELAGKRFHSHSEKHDYAIHTTNMPKSSEPVQWQAVWRTDGLAREQAFAKLKTIDWPRQARMLRDGSVPFAMINGPEDPFINHAYCRDFGYGNIWGGSPRNIPDAGHAPFVQRPEEFNKVYSGFLGWVGSL